MLHIFSYFPGFEPRGSIDHPMKLPNINIIPLPPGVKCQNVTHRRDGPKIGRNAPCICGSGKKYKNCCGKRLEP